jgi:hypothetical protein
MALPLLQTIWRQMAAYVQSELGKMGKEVTVV